MSSSSEDEFSAKEFDPVKFLYSKNRTKPEGLCVFDNVASLVGYYKRNGQNLEEIFDKTKKPQNITKSVPLLRGEVVERRFQPHQMMMPGRAKKARHDRNFFTNMEKVEGPMSQLNLWVKDKTRVKVLVRKNHGIRGTITGIIRLFDAHWSLVLTDVEETYRRRKWRYGTNISAETATEEMVVQRLKALGLEHPLKDVATKSVDKKRVEVTRKYPILLLKGDQVAVVLKA